MDFLLDFISEFISQFIFDKFKWIGIFIKWIFYLGKKPINQIKKENWNNRIGFITIISLIGLIIYLVN
jgi:hypothetical protein